MRRFSAGYLAETRRGMWEDRAALEGLDLPNRTRVLDVGCGTGALTRILREESSATVVGLDADRSLLSHVPSPRVRGDAMQLPFRDGAFDLVVCQALLINLPHPTRAVREFARVSSELVAAVEPDNASVTIESTVDQESRLARQARDAYIDGVETDVTLGPDAVERFADAGLQDVSTTRHDHCWVVKPPYTEDELEGAVRKARGDRLADGRETMLAGDLDRAGFDALRDDWREMGRAAVDQMRDGEYHREESIPFYVTVGRV